MDIEISQILTQIVAFLIMLWVLKKYGWKPLLDTLDERRNKIASEFDEIAKKKEEAEQLNDKYSEKLRNIEAEARHKIQEAVQHGQKIAKEMQEEVQAQAKEVMLKARLEIQDEIGRAKKQLKNDLVNTSVSIAEKILKEKLDEDHQKKLIDEFVSKTELQ